MMLKKLHLFHEKGKEKGWKVMCEFPLPPAFVNGEKQGYYWKITNHTFPAVIMIEAEKTDWSIVTEDEIDSFFEWLIEVVCDYAQYEFPSVSISHESKGYPCYVISDFNDFIRFIADNPRGHRLLQTS